MSLSKFNKNIVKWAVETPEGMKYVKANSLTLGKEYPFLGCYISPDKKGFGETGVIISSIDNEVVGVNTPASFVDTIRAIRTDKEAIDEINLGNSKFIVSSYKNKLGQTGYSIGLVD